MENKFFGKSNLGINFIHTLNIPKIHSENKAIFVPYKDFGEIVNENNINIYKKFKEGILGKKTQRINEK